MDDEVGTWLPQITYGNIGGVRGDRFPPYIHKRPTVHTRKEEQEKTAKRAKYSGTTKVAKTPKEGKQHKISKKREGNEKGDRTTSKTPRYTVTRSKAAKKADSKSKQLRRTGNFSSRKFCTGKQCKIGMNKMNKKIIRQTNNTAKKSGQEYVYIFFKMSGTSKQNKQATVIYGSSNMCIF